MSEKIEVQLRKNQDWKMDEKCYFLIRYQDNKLEVRVMALSDNNLKGKFSKGNEMLKDYIGDNPEDLYYKIIKDDWITNHQHAIYLGSELRKAYIAMKKGLKYVQDEELKF